MQLNMLQSNFVSIQVWVTVYGVLCIGCFGIASSANQDGEDNDDLASMGAHEFADLHMCEEPPPPMNGELLCSKHKTRNNKYVCKAECEAGFQFPNGKKKGRHLCDLKTGKWSPSYIFPDCTPICTPPCENNGECVEGNSCVCTPEYRGSRCLYDLALCDPEKSLDVSGDWSCNHTSANTQCVLSCPPGTRYESQPADHYKCTIDGIWTPSSAPKCIPINIIEPPAINSLYSVSNAIKSTRPSSGVCATWSSSHYRTFDGGIYSFRGGSCPYLLAKDCEQNTFAIHVQNGDTCESAFTCSTSVTIYIGSEEYLLQNGEDGPVVRNEGENHPVPAAVDGLLFQMLSDYVTVNSPLGFRLKWNRKNTIILEITNLLKNKTCGLCGKFDGSVLNDFETSDGTITDNVEVFVNSWAMTHLGETCDSKALITDTCSERKERASEAEKHCRVIFSDKFSSCHALVDSNSYYEACKMDYCGCNSSGGACFCDSLAEYFRECSRLGGKVEGGWRNEELCPLSCPEGMLYKDCGSSCPRTCKGTVYDCEDSRCIDGCHCPEDHVLHDGRCVERRSCPCLHNGIEHQSGERVLQDCNACECTGGKWKCTEETCEARCSSTGDPHFTTFDGLSYEFLGSCPYYLVFHDNFTIVQESGPCSSETGIEPATESMYCTQSIRIEYGGSSVLLQPGIKITMNEKLRDLPLSESGFSISMVTDLFLKVRLENGINILWDGHNRIYIDAPPTMFDQTMGLCGTFNHNQNDDFLTPERDIEADVNTFAARWQASDSCQKRARRSARRTYDMQPQKVTDAEMLCSVLKSGTFSECHGEVDLEPFYKSCVNDLCLCGEKLEECLCPILADYSLSCTRKAIIMNWVDDIHSCKPECSGGQVYKECGNPCTCSCDAVASEDECKVQCVQGCTCPDGMTMNNEGFCIAIDQCPCLYDGKEYSASDITVQDTNICTCSNAKWQCHAANKEELKTFDPDSISHENTIEYVNCLEENNEEFTECVETCPRTCQNAHLPLKCRSEDCKPGCRCKDDFILDTDINKCVDIKKCGCIHANKKYDEGDTMKQDCNLCTCKSGQWQCTEKLCPGVCTAWGESHFKSYDGKIFDFQGDCEYILSKGKMKGASFTLSVQNVPCGTSGVTCSKSFTLDLGPVETDRGDQDETIGAEEKLTITRGDVLPKVSLGSRFIILESGLFVIVYTDVGVTLRWDRGTRIYVTLYPKWRNRVKGLCGNFNDDQADDFLTPFGGIPEATASIFADSWKVHEFCPEPKMIEDTCAMHPHRKGWAQQKCGIMKSDVFAACRAVVAVEAFYDRCVFDSCACDMGGDCDCLCTAVAAYAQECSIKGVPTKWRSQEFCPIQCEECSTYDSCISSCPKKTCENEYRYRKFEDACSEDFCVEGCDPKPCPEGQIYNNEKEYKCIPKVDCVVPCLEVNGVIYNEGDRITDLEVADPCQSCHCQRGIVNCVGNPCVKTEPIRPCIQTGWTPWMNTPSFVGGDYEELSNPVLKATYENFCGTTNMTGIECRVSGSKIPLEETGQKVVCELPLGLKCKDTEQRREICEDYEIRVFCNCGPMQLIEEFTLLPTSPPTLPPVCEETGWTPWMSSHLPNEEGESETLDMLRVNHYFCADHEIQDIECRTSLTWRYALPDDRDVLCNKKLGLVCTGPHCRDHEVRVYCKCGQEETTTLPPACVTGWTEYFNTDHPDHSETGDEESIERIREGNQFCSGGTIEDIECKTVVNDELVDYSTLDNFGLKCSKNVGFICNKYVRTDKCPDFMVRFYCVCEGAIETTLKTTTLAPTTTTPLPMTSVPVECGWTPWLNIDTPDTGEQDDGDTEDLPSIQFIYKTCGGKDLLDIECRISRTHHSYSESLQKNLQCDILHGFRCHNSDQIGKCYDYEIRLLCMYDWCYPPTTTPVPTTKTPTTTENPCPDGQVYDQCAYNCEQTCSSFAHDLSSKCSVAEGGCIAGCRPERRCTFPNVWRDYYTCVSKDECTCVMPEGAEAYVMAPNEIIVRGCEKCQCVHDDVKCFTIPGCGTTPKPAEPKRYIVDILREDCWTEWINVDNPKSEGGDLEVVNNIRGMYQFCPDPVKIECRTAESKQKPFDVGQVVTCDLETGLICWNNDNKPEDCYDYEIRFFCPCPTTLPPTTPTPLPTLEPGTCVFGWTDWYNSHQPDIRGDYESIQSGRVNNVFCANDMISAVECRRAGESDTGVLQHGVSCDLEVGLICKQEYLGESESCWDYEARWFCDCPTLAPVTEIEPSPPTTTQLPAQVACSYWSEWINEHHPSSQSASTKKGVKGAAVIRNDNEKAMPLKLQREQHFCLEGSVSDIECRESETDLDYAATGENLVCSLVSGFRCRGRDQAGRMCKDYKIRYFCTCNEISTTTVLTRPTTPVVDIEPCSVFYSVIDGPNPLPDSSLKTSSSKSGESGPQSARLSAVSNWKSAGAWVSGDISDHEFIEVDLGIIQPVYGIVTKGRNGHQEWVKSYKVMYSRNGMSYAYVTEHGNQDKIFSGNYDSDSRVEHVFSRPFEARFVRIQPVTYHKEIAMRVDLLGCAEGMTTIPVLTTQPPPCTDDMGLTDGGIADYQIKTSSDRSDNSAGRFVRLNTIQTSANSGGWVAADLDDRQFVQIDFIDPRVLTGVKIQGRDSVPQWVTAFTVSYSSDAVNWNDILEYSTENKRIFTGNYDSDTISTIYFPQAIRARYIRIIPISWNNWIAMRLEILGCYERFQELVKDNIHSTSAPIMLEECSDPMGFENHQIPDAVITVSSSESPASDQSRIRLNTPSDDKGTGGWIAAVHDYKPVVIVDFMEERNLSGIITQGLVDMDKWVMSFYVHYSIDNITYEKVYDKETGNMVFPGNFDRNTPVLKLFSWTILTRYLKITIIDYHTGPALRMEVLGCFVPYEEIVPPPPVLMTTTEFCVQNGPWISLSDPASKSKGDIEPISKVISASGLCSNPIEIQCRTLVTRKDYSQTGQSVTCDLEQGLRCLNREQNSYMCYNYEVRIKCWSCGMLTTTPTLLPLELCPEVPEPMKETCPTTCPIDYVCDGYNCVPRMDCPCFKEDKKFQPSNIYVTSDCKRCECLLGGYSNCKSIECPTCLPGQKSKMDDHCECHCVGCAEGTVLCPTSGECINESQWCDGIVDCPNDEKVCPTTIQVTTTTTVAPTTTELPIICSTDNGAEIDTCEMNANLFDTFDGMSYQYDICDHVLMRERSSHLYSVTVHKTCASDSHNSCQKYLVIEQDGVVLKIGPSTEDITVQDNRVSSANLWVVSRRFQDFELKKKGNTIVFKSKKYFFDVLFDSVQDVKIVVSKCLADQVVGLCGLYNKNPADDRMTHDGKLVNNNEDFGNSWSIGSPERCTPPACPEHIMRKAIAVCKALQEEPFNSCSDSLRIESRVESCIVYMCECLQRSELNARKSSDVFYDIYDTGECKCLAYESFVEACEATKPEPVPEWRIQHECTPECPPGMEWQDCGPGCELTCDNYHERETLCNGGGCTPGCYCPAGTVRHHDRCVKPKMCQDCVCRGHGDPNYITFDGRYYAFQGNCTYVLAQHLDSEDKNINFKILATNVECPEEPHTSCTDGLQIFWNGHTIEKFKNKPVYIDGEGLDNSPFEKDGITITFVPGKSTIIHIKSINLAVRYFDQMYGFNIELPAFYYYNKTEGLCGVCNFIQSDDLYHRDGFITENIDDFAYSWLEEPDRREHCQLPRVVAPEPPPGICNFTVSPCETFLDPELYSMSCQNDVTYSHKPEASMCRSKFQYAQQCCERGISLVEWLRASGCEYSCPDAMHFACTSACPKTCDNYKDYRAEDCDLMPLYTCHCPAGQVQQLGACVAERECEVCDSRGHAVGDVWGAGPCERCECMGDLSTRCTIVECPGPPACRERETLERVEGNTSACCDVYQCVEMAEISCPEAKLQDCARDEANVITHENECPVYHCECMPKLCPPLLVPLLEEGEQSSIESDGCCPFYATQCHPDECGPPPACKAGFRLSTQEGKCCLQYACVPKKNVCVYQYKYDVVNGTQLYLTQEEYYDMEYEAGASWQDGLCRKCSCVEIDGQHAFSCREEICPSPEEFPDAEKYERELIHVPGACCPKYRRIACKVDGIPYLMESEWPSPDGDNCKSYKCVNERGEAAILEKTTVCDRKCPDYAIYVEPSSDSKKCCGECKPVACEENGILYQDGSTWVSTTKACFTAKCSVTPNGTHIVYQGESCPPLPDNCPMENVKTDPKGCCSYCKQSTESCSAVQVPIHETRGYFGYVDRVKGFCSNEDALEDLTKCAGQCSTDSQYSNLIGDFESVCNCCLPHRTEHRLIVLDCEDGSKVEKVYQQPSSCQCSNCSGRYDRSLESMNKIEQV